jgi:AcrR family transcriptional regulator
MTGRGSRAQQLLDAALEIIGERGIGGLTLRGVAERVGVTEPALYRHFSGKTQLLHTLFQRAEEEFSESFARLSDSGVDTREALYGFFREVYGRFRRYPGYASLLLSEELHHYGEGLAERMSATIERQVWRLSGYIEEGIAAGRFRPDLDPLSTAQIFLGMVRLEVTRRRLEAVPWDPEERARVTGELFFRILSSVPADDTIAARGGVDPGTANREKSERSES